MTAICPSCLCRKAAPGREDRSGCAVDSALDDMPEEFVIRPFLLENRAEEKSMFLTEYNEEKILKQERMEGRKEGRMEARMEGRMEGRHERSIEIAKDLLKEEGMTVAFIARISRLSEDVVRDLAKTMGVFLT